MTEGSLKGFFECRVLGGPSQRGRQGSSANIEHSKEEPVIRDAYAASKMETKLGYRKSPSDTKGFAKYQAVVEVLIAKESFRKSDIVPSFKTIDHARTRIPFYFHHRVFNSQLGEANQSQEQILSDPYERNGDMSQ